MWLATLPSGTFFSAVELAPDNPTAQIASPSDHGRSVDDGKSLIAVSYKGCSGNASPLLRSTPRSTTQPSDSQSLSRLPTWLPSPLSSLPLPPRSASPLSLSTSTTAPMSSLPRPRVARPRPSALVPPTAPVPTTASSTRSGRTVPETSTTRTAPLVRTARPGPATAIGLVARAGFRVLAGTMLSRVLCHDLN
jgi:hypothetical protein